MEIAIRPTGPSPRSSPRSGASKAQRTPRRSMLVGGVTVLTANVDGGTYSGYAPMNVAKTVAKLYYEYALPFAPQVSLTGGVYHVGKQWATATNTRRLPSYTTFDLGLRYVTEVAGKPVSLRPCVNNVADRDYWLNSDH